MENMIKLSQEYEQVTYDCLHDFVANAVSKMNKPQLTKFVNEYPMLIDIASMNNYYNDNIQKNAIRKDFRVIAKISNLNRKEILLAIESFNGDPDAIGYDISDRDYLITFLEHHISKGHSECEDLLKMMKLESL